MRKEDKGGGKFWWWDEDVRWKGVWGGSEW